MPDPYRQYWLHGRLAPAKRLIPATPAKSNLRVQPRNRFRFDEFAGLVEVVVDDGIGGDTEAFVDGGE